MTVVEKFKKEAREYIKAIREDLEVNGTDIDYFLFICKSFQNTKALMYSSKELRKADLTEFFKTFY
ncbi:hypothetical protein kac65v162_gp026 [Nodularia phage vB_NspS-kac65v162]|jgi:hypothetical protein|uniref:Uncharacterized protein n=6 Tax=Ravarandavirus TaxID=2843444 RepID=A0A482MJW5_9CAUD|nr:hypothetical protein HWA92_gp024 [Nodularia phage vB_NpeS-2AV2]YP_009844629.1 hypothetical protein HWC12_gp026 [Nodularia phage vB_NspS-kac65v151]YP_009844839.1 hypothetical protein HWC13_gp030 [Nodularia phage vB_NspS-kac68v161]QBQ73264.1 hypothetical protein kac65v161_gp026 [Nodularia phage vB_NspS-kac65v161]QBQ73470.1 hypothetical protein kac65v162_gp026 [Nodularia phage vB_NspS-kac65v162]QBQ73878.1 hypothetical protein kac68v162_gp030 [Nodularia phage vB_NspS-kac68v162]ALY07476.1 hypot